MTERRTVPYYPDTLRKLDDPVESIPDALDCIALEQEAHARFYEQHGESKRGSYARANGMDLRRFAASLRERGIP